MAVSVAASKTAVWQRSITLHAAVAYGYTLLETAAGPLSLTLAHLFYGPQRIVIITACLPILAYRSFLLRAQHGSCA